MQRIIFLSLFSLSLYAIGYPKPYSTFAAPLFEARVKLDYLVSQPTLRHHILDYEAQSDRVLGEYRRIKYSSETALKKDYFKALQELKKSYDALFRHLHLQLTNAIEENNYTLFLAIIETQSEDDYKSPYLREKIYNYYSAHRQQGTSPYLDERIRKEWATIASYYPSKGLVNYANTDNAYYREVILLKTVFSPYSAKVREFLQDNNVKFKEYDIEESDEGRALFEQYKGKYIPLLIINNRVIEGYNEFEMDKLLRR